MQQNAAERHQPDTERVQARESHVARADLQRQNVVGYAEEDWHGDEKNHRRAVHSEEPVVSVRSQQRVVRHGQLQPDKKRFHAGDHEEHEAGQHVQDADAFVIDGRKPRQFPVLSLRGRQKPGDRGGNGRVPVHFSVSSAVTQAILPAKMFRGGRQCVLVAAIVFISGSRCNRQGPRLVRRRI
jgi:hypothetical protein